ncbi:MAG: HigA family addiction module antidote protein [Chromatiaceae bacterium]|nr:HigA family addiction module antidote protein [Chromatiaceae bacterium]
MPLKNKIHPGEVIRALCLEPLGLTMTDAARGLGVAEEILAGLIDGHDRISPEMAIRLSKGFGGSAESWLRQQMQYDLAQIAEQADEIDVKRLGSA